MNVRYKPTKLVLYQQVPRIIRAYRLPPHSDGSPGRAKGDANPDEIAGANDILYHLMSTESIAFMAKTLGVSRQRVYDAIDLCMHKDWERGEMFDQETLDRLALSNALEEMERES